MTDFVAKALIFNSQEQVLLLTRADDDDHRPGEADLPGGGVEAGESFDSAVIREIQEEIGITLKLDEIELVFAHTGTKNDKNVIRFMYIGRIATNTPVVLSPEHSNYEWVKLDSAINAFNHPIWKSALIHVRDKLL